MLGLEGDAEGGDQYKMYCSASAVTATSRVGLPVSTDARHWTEVRGESTGGAILDIGGTFPACEEVTVDIDVLLEPAPVGRGKAPIADATIRSRHVEPGMPMWPWWMTPFTERDPDARFCAGCPLLASRCRRDNWPAGLKCDSSRSAVPSAGGSS
jgi:hypothetical protein